MEIFNVMMHKTLRLQAINSFALTVVTSSWPRPKKTGTILDLLGEHDIRGNSLRGQQEE